MTITHPKVGKDSKRPVINGEAACHWSMIKDYARHTRVSLPFHASCHSTILVTEFGSLRGVLFLTRVYFAYGVTNE